MRAFQQRGQEGAQTEGAHATHRGGTQGHAQCTREARRHERYELTGRGQPEQMSGKAVFARKQDKALATGTCCVL